MKGGEITTWVEWASFGISIVSLIASVTTCVTFAITAWKWAKDKSRIVDAFPDIANIGTWTAKRGTELLKQGSYLRIQNIGATGMCIQTIWMKSCEVSFKMMSLSKETISNILMPGQSMNIPCKNIGEDATVVLEYVTHSDSKTIRFERFKLSELIPTTYLLQLYSKPTRRQKKKEEYAGGQLFDEAVIGDRRRYIHDITKNKMSAFDNATNWLAANHYQYVVVGTGMLSENNHEPRTHVS